MSYYGCYLKALVCVLLSLSHTQEEAIKAFSKTYDKTVSLGQRLDLVFHNIRLGLFYLDHSLITRNLEKAKR